MNAYTKHFTTSKNVEAYYRKFSRRIDRIRHEIEVNLIAAHASGELFDCSIGSGRFIGEFTNVANYSGMDYSQEFVRRIAERHSDVHVVQGDLLSGIPVENDRYDIVLCIRTLFALPRTKEIIGDMVRICRPRGVVIFDYGCKPKLIDLGSEEPFLSSAENIPLVLNSLPVSIKKRYHLDHLLTKIKRSRVATRLFHHRFNIIPNSIWHLIEKGSFFIRSDRRLYVIEKLER